MKMICRMSPSTNGLDHAVGDQVGDELPPLLGLAGGDQLLRRFAGLDLAGVGVDAVADAEHIDRDQAEDHREDGADLEVGQCLEPGHADLFQVGDAGDAADDGEEDDGADQHLHRGDERGADRFHRDPRGWAEPADEDPDDDRHQNPEVELLVPAFLDVIGPVGLGGGVCVHDVTSVCA